MSTLYVHPDAALLNFLTGGGLSGVDTGVDTGGVVTGVLCRFASSRLRVTQYRCAPSIIAAVGFHSDVSVGVFLLRGGFSGVVSGVVSGVDLGLFS